MVVGFVFSQTVFSPVKVIIFNDVWIYVILIHVCFPTDITGVGDIVGDVIRFNVCHYVCHYAFLSTHFA